MKVTEDCPSILSLDKKSVSNWGYPRHSSDNWFGGRPTAGSQPLGSISSVPSLAQNTLSGVGAAYRPEVTPRSQTGPKGMVSNFPWGVRVGQGQEAVGFLQKSVLGSQGTGPFSQRLCCCSHLTCIEACLKHSVTCQITGLPGAPSPALGLFVPLPGVCHQKSERQAALPCFSSWWILKCHWPEEGPTAGQTLFSFSGDACLVLLSLPAFSQLRF